jgi:hypothetical protein
VRRHGARRGDAAAGEASRSRSFDRCRHSSRPLTAIATALGCATSTASCRPRVTPMQSRFRRSIGQCWVVTGITTAGCSEPCALGPAVA